MKTGLIITITLGLASVAAWITHIYWSLSGLFSGSMNETNEYVVAILGVFLPPIGVVHGVYLWF